MPRTVCFSGRTLWPHTGSVLSPRELASAPLTPLTPRGLGEQPAHVCILLIQSGTLTPLGIFLSSGPLHPSAAVRACVLLPPAGVASASGLNSPVQAGGVLTWPQWSLTVVRT